jgi:hypothetical protein
VTEQVTGGDGKDEINPERKTIHENSPYFFVFAYGHFIHSPHPFLPFTLVSEAFHPCDWLRSQW